MPRIFLILLIFLPLTSFAANSSFYVYTVAQDSWISIEGTTNVNTFRCESPDQVTSGLLLADYDLEKEAVYFSDASLVLPVSSFDCGNRRMNRDFTEAMGGETHPDIEIKLLETMVRESPCGMSEYIIAHVDIFLNGKHKRVEVPVELSTSDQLSFHIHGKTTLKMSDFNIDPPSPAMGLIKVRDEMEVIFNLVVEVNMLSDL